MTDIYVVLEQHHEDASVVFVTTSEVIANDYAASGPHFTVESHPLVTPQDVLTTIKQLAKA